jgi:hypothetical protein
MPPDIPARILATVLGVIVLVTGITSLVTRTTRR